MEIWYGDVAVHSAHESDPASLPQRQKGAFEVTGLTAHTVWRKVDESIGQLKCLDGLSILFGIARDYHGLDARDT